MNLFMIYATCAGILLWDFRPRAASVGAKERVLYLLLLAIGLAALTLNALGINLPSVALAFQKAFVSLFGKQ